MRRKAFTLIEIMIVVLLISILLAIAVPQFLSAREQSSRTICIENQQMLDDAKVMFNMESRSGQANVPDMADLVPDYVRQTPMCPMNGTYALGDERTSVTCSIHPRKAAGAADNGQGNGNGNGNNGNNGQGNGNGNGGNGNNGQGNGNGNGNNGNNGNRNGGN